MKRRAFTIADALRSPKLLGAGLGPIECWTTWLAILKGAYGLPLDSDELATFQSVTGNRKPPSKRVDESWFVIGRCSGKSKIAAAIAVYEATCVDHSAKLSRGETGYVLVLASTVSQAKTVFDYCKGYIEASPLLSQLVERILSDEIRLTNGITISVHPCSYRSVRGRTLVCAILDEVAFWRSDESATPDTECYRALLPSLATTGGPMIGISSPYRKLGLLHTKWRDSYGVDDDDVLVAQGPSTRFNPTLSQRIIDRDMKADPEAAKSEWGGEFRSDLSSLLDDELIDAAIDGDRPPELAPVPGTRYHAFVDPSGGAHDSFCIGISHKTKDDVIVIDVLRGVAAHRRDHRSRSSRRNTRRASSHARRDRSRRTPRWHNHRSCCADDRRRPCPICRRASPRDAARGSACRGSVGGHRDGRTPARSQDRFLIWSPRRSHISCQPSRRPC
jgi:hypothetical protein